MWKFLQWVLSDSFRLLGFLAQIIVIGTITVSSVAIVIAAVAGCFI